MTGTNGRHPPRPRDYRCRHCGRLLFRAYLPPGAYVEIRCTKTQCGRVTVIEADPLPMAVIVPAEAGQIVEQPVGV